MRNERQSDYAQLSPAFLATTLMVVLFSAFAIAQATKQDSGMWKPVEDAMGRPGQMQPGDVIKFSMPRKDLHVTVELMSKPDSRWAPGLPSSARAIRPW